MFHITSMQMAQTDVKGVLLIFVHILISPDKKIWEGRNEMILRSDDSKIMCNEICQ